MIIHEYLIANCLKKLRTLKIATFSLLFLAACSSVNTAPEKTYYVLKQSGNSTASMVSGTPSISIRGVKLPGYLNQQGIVRQLPNGQVNVSYTDQWAEKLSESISTLLAEELSVQLQQPIEQHPLPPGIKVSTVIEVHISHFIGTPKELQLRASYRIVKRPKQLNRFTFATTIPLRDNRTSTLVDAYATAISRLSGDITMHLYNK